MLDYRANKLISDRAEALRQSMLALMNNDEKPHYAYPLFWALFMVVGEGDVCALERGDVLSGQKGRRFR